MVLIMLCDTLAAIPGWACDVRHTVDSVGISEARASITIELHTVRSRTNIITKAEMPENQLLQLVR